MCLHYLLLVCLLVFVTTTAFLKYLLVTSFLGWRPVGWSGKEETESALEKERERESSFFLVWFSPFFSLGSWCERESPGFSLLSLHSLPLFLPWWGWHCLAHPHWHPLPSWALSQLLAAWRSRLTRFHCRLQTWWLGSSKAHTVVCRQWSLEQPALVESAGRGSGGCLQPMPVSLPGS